MRNLKQRILSFAYPVLIRIGKWTGARARVYSNSRQIPPPVSFYALSARLNDGSSFSFDKLKGRKVLIVNTALECGYTEQLAELKWLWDNYRDGLEVIGFPSNDFKDQEPNTDEVISAFCRGVYRVQFPFAAKSVVRKANGQNEVFRWLTNASLNGWNDREPSWNFTKFLIDEEGVLTHYFEAGVSPASAVFLKALQ